MILAPEVLFLVPPNWLKWDSALPSIYLPILHALSVRQHFGTASPGSGGGERGEES